MSVLSVISQHQFPPVIFITFITYYEDILKKGRSRLLRFEYSQEDWKENEKQPIIQDYKFSSGCYVFFRSKLVIWNVKLCLNCLLHKQPQAPLPVPGQDKRQV